MSRRDAVWLTVISGYFVCLMGFDVPVAAQPSGAVAPAAVTAEDMMARTEALVRRPRSPRCIRQTEDEILVCVDDGKDQKLPLPHENMMLARRDVPRAPTNMPCGRSISNNCYSGIDLPKLASAVVKGIGLILDPDSDLGPPSEGPR